MYVGIIIIIIIISKLYCVSYKNKAPVHYNYHYQFNKILGLQLTMSLEVAFETVESGCLSKFIRYSELHASGPTL